MKPLALILLFSSCILAGHSQDNLQDSIFIPVSSYEFIPGEAYFELIQDRIKCIEKTIPLEYNTRVHAFVNYFTIKDREYTKSVLRKKDVYFPLFEKYLAKYGLPDELKYLSIVESGLNPEARSRVGAMGLLMNELTRKNLQRLLVNF